MCKKMTFLLMLAFILMSLPAVADITISRVEPANWWIGMKKTEFQILVYGPNIGRSKVLIHYPGVSRTGVNGPPISLMWGQLKRESLGQG